MRYADLLRLAARLLKRDWRAGELRILALSLSVAVGAVTAVAFLTDRVQRAMTLQASEILAADLVIESSAPVRPLLVEQARAQGLRIARAVTFPSVVLSAGRTQLVQVKAVNPRYPLRGNLRVQDERDASPVQTDRVPALGHAWADTRLMLNLGLNTGATLKLGERRLRLSKIIDYEPDRGGQWFQLAPRVMINLKDLASTGLVNANSRVSYHTLLAGSPAAVESYRAWLEPRARPTEEIQGLRDGRPELRTALERAQQYLGLAALVAVLVAGAAIALTARHFAHSQADASAIMRCLGASQATVLQIYTVRLMTLGLIASLLGCVLGYAAHTGLIGLLEGWLAQEPPQPGSAPVATGIAVGLLSLIGFALPPILRLKQVPPLRVLRRDFGDPVPAAWVTATFSFAALCLLLVWQAQEATLIGWLLFGAALAVAGLWLAAFLIMLGVRRLARQTGVAWKSGIARIARHSGLSLVQITAFALGIGALLVLAIARVDLLNTWQATLPARAPTHFMINIQPHELKPLARLFRAYGVPEPEFFPMVQGRLVAINNRKVGPRDYAEPRAKQLISREFNLSWATRVQGDNEIVAGEWWGAPGAHQKAFSVETEIAETLGIELGDRLRYLIADQAVAAPVVNLRAVAWDSFNVNFFVIGTPALLEDHPASRITAFYLPPEREEMITALARQFPSLTVLNVQTLIEQVRTIMDRAALAVEYVFLFTLFAGLLVMYAAIQTNQQERRQETALLRALGASRKQLVSSLAAEFGAIGLIASALAATAASIAGYVLATELFELPYGNNPWLWACGIGVGTIGVVAAGLLGTRRLLNQSPLFVLRRV